MSDVFQTFTTCTRDSARERMERQRARVVSERARQFESTIELKHITTSHSHSAFHMSFAATVHIVYMLPQTMRNEKKSETKLRKFFKSKHFSHCVRRSVNFVSSTKTVVCELSHERTTHKFSSLSLSFLFEFLFLSSLFKRKIGFWISIQMKCIRQIGV